MAQGNFIFDDAGIAISGVNGNTTSAITAGDILYASGPSTSPFGTTVPAGVGPEDIEVEPIKFATAITDTLGGRIVGVAEIDAAISTTTKSRVSFITRGLILSPVIDTTGYIQPGMPVRAAEGETTPGITNCGTTTGPTAKEGLTWIGRALTGANTSGDYCLWLLNIR